MRMEKLVEWINVELAKRGWSMRELERRSGITHGHISLVLSGQRGVGPEFCTALAQALGVSPEFVFRLAGLLPPGSENQEREKELLYHFDRLPEEDQELAILLVEAMAERRESYVAGREVRPRAEGAAPAS